MTQLNLKSSVRTTNCVIIIIWLSTWRTLSHLSSMQTVDRLLRMEIECSRHYQENMLKLESKYKLRIDDLIDEKILVQHKLHESFENQMKKLFELKLSILQNPPVLLLILTL